MALIGGPAGLGKSRLAREAAAAAERLGMVVYTGNCLDMESPPPYQPAIDHLEQAARTASPEGVPSRSGSERARGGQVAAVAAAALRRHPAVARPDPRAGAPLHAPRGGRVHRARRRTRPMVLTYEDLHWADESTLLLLRHLGGRVGDLPLVVIGTYRDDELERGRPLTTAIGPLFRDVGAVDLRPRLLTDRRGGRGAARPGRERRPASSSTSSSPRPRATRSSSRSCSATFVTAVGCSTTRASGDRASRSATPKCPTGCGWSSGVGSISSTPTIARCWPRPRSSGGRSPSTTSPPSRAPTRTISSTRSRPPSAVT